ncbi:WecB/TagA/CpsF family glycosyltransferase [Candidatus Bipolaricaulota bacterium]|nr:WecB/TagA/CpsF family glycosyltransferase [Candidatus Bipolaricaulota bacterium]
MARISRSTKYDLSPVGYLLILSLPFSLWLVEGFSRPLTGIVAGLIVISLGRMAGAKNSIYDLLGLLAASLVAYLLGFRIQFIQTALGGDYIYFTWLGLPITVAWLYLVSKSVEFLHYEIGEDRWKVFTTTILVITGFFVLLVGLQNNQSLQFPLNIGYGFLGVLTGILLFSPSKKVTSVISLQFGFVLASLAVAGVVKSLTAFVLLVPIAPLAIPTARRSFSFASATVSDGRKSLIEQFTGDYMKSNAVGIFLTYTGLSYLGLVLAWYLWDPSTASLAALVSTAAVLPGTFLLGRRFVESFADWSPELSKRGNRANILGTSFHLTGLEEARERMERLASEEGTSYVATPDVTAVVKAERDEVLRRSFSRADIVTPDGFGLIWASGVHDLKLEDRVAGIDLLEDLFESTAGLKVYLLGSLPGVARRAGEKISRGYAGVEVVGTHHGYDPIDDRTVLQEVNEADPDILLVGLGVPRQEQWILANIDKVKANLVMGVGGSFDVISERLPRAPEVMRDNGLEWLYRIWLEPRRLWKARLIPYFMARVLKDKFKLALRNEIL